jgi:hypothetical protein
MKRNALIIAGLGSGRTRSVTTTIDEAFTLDEQQLKRERGLHSKNEARQQAAERNYQKYRGIARMLIAGNPQLRGATHNRLAKEVQAELIKRGRKVTARTIVKAFRLKNKV